jgi:CRISPR-associated protein Cas2
MMPTEKRATGGAPGVRRRRQWLAVAYDIEDDKRRLRVMKTLEGYGKRVQYSVFESEVRPEDVDKLYQRLGELVDEQADDVRFYLLCEHCLGKLRTLGKAKRYEQVSVQVV